MLLKKNKYKNIASGSKTVFWDVQATPEIFKLFLENQKHQITVC